MELIKTENLSLQILGKPILQNLTLSLGREKFGLVGESGSGKSMFVKTLLGVQPKAAELAAKTFSWCGESLLKFREKDWRKIRGSSITMIPQDAKASLNPLVRIEKQLLEVGDNPLLALKRAHLHDPERVLKLYPFQLSGGMAQRVMIAMMLLQGPQFLIADEIVSALDAPLQKEILSMLQERITEKNMGLLYITHDLEQAFAFCDRIGVMQKGKLIFTGTPSEVQKSSDPYIKALLDARLV